MIVTYLELREKLFGRENVDISLDEMCRQCPAADCDTASLWCQRSMAIGKPNDAQKRRRREEERAVRRSLAVN